MPQQRWHWLRLRTTCHPTEDIEKVEQALRHCTGLGDDDFQPLLTQTVIESHHGGEVILLEVSVERAKDIRTALSVLGGAEQEELSCSVDPRTDEDGVFHFRLSKQEAALGRTRLTSGDDAVQVRLKPEVHPASRDGAMAAIRAWLDGSN